MKKSRRLYQLLRPNHYTLSVSIDAQKEQFKGSVLIEAELVENTNSVMLHSKGLSINQATIKGKTSKEKADVALDEETDELHLNTSREFEAGPIEIHIQYSATITPHMEGIYPSKYIENKTEKMLLSTQFESNHAREVFPCIDEPEAKALFDLAITIPSSFGKVISNTPLKNTSKLDKFTTFSFETTPKMPTYLLAFVAGELDYKETTSKHGVQVRVYATKEHVEHTDFALETAKNVLDFYNDYFDIPYPLNKCDMVAIPEFASGAMENWGLITYRESAILVDPARTSLSNKQWVALVIAHELAHQWFGNLVTMRWWTDLWLNEGFASWVEYLAVDHLFPEWEMWSQFVSDDYLGALHLDALSSSHPIEVPVNNPKEINEIFDAISYRKGASIIRMLNAYLGADTFRAGLNYYLKKHSYSNATTRDLWDALSKASNQDVLGFMNAWTSQTGFPMIHFNSQGDVEQSRFFVSPRERANRTDNSVWPVPLQFNDQEKKKLLLSSSQKGLIDVPATPKLNPRQTGFFYTNYTQPQLEAIAQKISTQAIHVNDRMGLLSEMFELSKAGETTTVRWLEFLKHYAKERHHSVWGIIGSSIHSIASAMPSPRTDKALRTLLDAVIGALYDEVGWEQSEDDDHNTKLLRPIVLGLACRFEYKDAAGVARQIYSESSSSLDIHPDLVSIVLQTVARTGDKTDFNRILNEHNATQFAEQRRRLAAALTRFEQPDLIKQSLDLVRSKEVRLQDTISWLAGSFRNPHARPYAWQWLQENWNWVEKQYGHSHLYTYYVQILGSFNTEADVKSIKTFFDKRNTVGISMTLDQVIESILTRHDWRERDHKAILAFLNPQ